MTTFSDSSENSLPLVPSIPGDLREHLARHRADLVARLARGEDGQALGRRHAAVLDGVMKALFASARGTLGGDAPPLALAAVGSYGRGAVALRSDADVRLIVPSRARARDAASTFADALLYPLWDAGFSVGHQVVTIDEALDLAATDLASATSLLDLRLVAGEAEVVDALLDRAFRGIFEESALGAFVTRLEEEAQGRHARFGGSVYLLEPDVKAGAGGLRDLDGARWASRARFNVKEPGPSAGPNGMHGIWGELVRLGVLVSREAHEIFAAEEFLWRVRNRLHAHAERRSDRLTFDEQESVAIELGYARSVEGAPRPDAPPDGHGEGERRVVEVSHEARARAAERLMQDYYLQARVVSRARERLLERARPLRRRGKPVETDLGRGVKLFDGQVTIAGVAELTADPALAFRVYAACVRHGAPVFPYAREAIARAAADAAFCEALRASPEARELFVDLLCTVQEVRTKRGSLMSELHDVGLLLAMIPEFRPVTGRVHHDVYHVYTVDVHSVAAVDCLRALARGELAHAYPLASRLAAEIARPRPLFLATLLHDVGKGYPDATGSRKNHSKSGAELCDVILPRLGVSAEDAAEARSLVLQHLAMYHVATKRDLDDPAAIEEFCRLVKGREGLRDLYLLTVADITTTSPTAMTTWKARMLDELYFASDAHLAGKPASAFSDERLERVFQDAGGLWTGDRAFFERFVRSMPERYLLANAPEAIVAHARAAEERGDRPVHVVAAPSRHPDVAELCVVADDRPGLLASIAAAITSNRLEVLAAQVYSRNVTPTATAGADPNGATHTPRVEAVDLFWVRDRNDGAVPVERTLPRLARDLDEVVTGRLSEDDVMRSRTASSSPWRERRSPAVTSEVVLDDRASPRHTVVEVYAKDRPGLLYTLAKTLHALGLSIVLSKINTEGTKVADVFYVNELDGGKVHGGDRARAVRETLLRAVTEEAPRDGRDAAAR